MSFGRNSNLFRHFWFNQWRYNSKNFTSASAKSRNLQDLLRQNLGQNGRFVVVAVLSGVTGSAFCYIGWTKGHYDHLFHHPTTSSKNKPEKRKLTSREKRFIKFASVEYDGQIYMTPQDFLESVVEGEPRPRLKRKRLNPSELAEIQSRLPKLYKNDQNFFRSLGNQGIISFSEYLFLLTILIKPQTGFKIAFAMLDQDGNERIDKAEFKLLESVFSSAARERKSQLVALASGEDQDRKVGPLTEPTSPGSKKQIFFDDDDHGLMRAHNVDTSLLIYFFGKKGTDQLKFEDFHKFMENLQSEVLEMEFQEFSKGAKFITELDFAKILLRYTFLNSEDYEAILCRLVDRLAEEEFGHPKALSYDNNSGNGINFGQFKDFCLFLNNLDDFQIAMRMYTLADKAISEEEFSRAVNICTGRRLSPHLVHTVFQIFDNDGDGLLSYQEFIAMMKDRVNRGLKSFSRQEGWVGFKRCIKQEVRAN